MAIEIVEAAREETASSIDHTAIDIENEYLALTASVENEMDACDSLSGECTIHRVRESLRQLDEKAYTPRIVSIGPIHHCKEEFKAMEHYKRKYLKNFVHRTEVRLDKLIKVIKKKEVELRNCYEETIELGSDDLVKMILMDATFIFEVFLIHYCNEKYDKFDRVYGSPRKRYDVMDDLFMLENQLPFFILEDLFMIAKSVRINVSSNKYEKLSLLEITHEVTKFRWGYLGMEESLDEGKYSKVDHLVDFLRRSIVPSKSIEKDREEILTTSPSVTKLHQAGVKFRLGSSKNLFDIRFKNGILEIPRITIRSPMKYVVKNLLAFEKSQSEVHLLNHYFIFMNCLANTPKDVELLVQHEIIHNRLGDGEQVTSLFHSLVERPTFNFNPPHFHFSLLVEELNKYCRRPWHKWKATLKQDYFKTPWTTVSVIAAAFLITLTLIQTLCSIIQLKSNS